MIQTALTERIVPKSFNLIDQVSGLYKTAAKLQHYKIGDNHAKVLSAGL